MGTTPDKTFEVFRLDPHVSNSLAMNIFSCYNSSKSTFFYPRYRLEALKKGHRRHQLILSLGSPNNSSQFPSLEGTERALMASCAQTVIGVRVALSEPLFAGMTETASGKKWMIFI